MARNLRDVVGTIGTLDVRLAAWRPPSGPDKAYDRRYIPVKPQDRFVSGQQFDFTADLEMRDWVIDDFSGGVVRGEFWDPNTGGVKGLREAYVVGDFVTMARHNEVTQQSAADFNGGRLFIANGKLWSGEDDTIYDWTEGSDVWNASGVSTGFAANDFISSAAMPIYDQLYLANEVDDEIRKITNLENTPSNAVHYAASGTGDDFSNPPVLIAFGAKLFALDGASLYEIDQSTADTRTLVSDLGSEFIEADVSTDGYYARLSTSSVGPIWWVMGTDGWVYIYEYNVGADTTDRIGKIPVRNVSPWSIIEAFGFIWVSFVERPIGGGDSGRAYVYYQRGGQSGVIGPIPGEAKGYIDGADEYQYGNETPYIFGALGDDLIVAGPEVTYAYNVSNGSWSQIAPAAGTSGGASHAGDAPAGGGIVFGRDIFRLIEDDSGGENIYRYEAETNHTKSGPLRFITTGRWHFGYPNVQKIFTEVTLDMNVVPTGTSIQLLYATDSSDDADFSTHGTSFSSDGSVNSFTWTLSSNSATVSGYDLTLRFDISSRAGATSTELLEIYRIRVRATSANSRREWQLILDASNSASAGFEQDDVTFLGALETLKTNKAVVQFTDPWQQTDDGTADTFDVIVEDVSTPAATHGEDDQREALVVLREVGLV